MRRLTASIVLVGALFFAIAAGALALVSVTTTPAEAGGCRCPLIYAPVVCDHGKTYPNMCEADCHHATGCVPVSPA